MEGAAPWTQFAPQHGADASGWELWRIILEPGRVVTTAGGAIGQELHDICETEREKGNLAQSVEVKCDVFNPLNIDEVTAVKRKFGSNIFRIFIYFKFYVF